MVSTTGMSRDLLPDDPQNDRFNSSRKQRNLEADQTMIYRFLLNLVKTQPPELVFQEFKRLFFTYEVSPENTEALQSLSGILFANDEEEFKNTLKRCCYILINNWETARQYKAIQELVASFEELKLSKKTLSPTLSRLRVWQNNFIASQDYLDLKLFTSRYEESHKTHWSSRYTSFLLVSQYTDANNPAEQREAARLVAQQLKDKFKFELAMYTARSQSATSGNKALKNPTGLGDEVLRLIKRIVAKRGPFSYTNLANIFLKQINQLSYQEFKTCLQRYLIFSVENRSFVEIINKRLAEALENLYERHHEDNAEPALILRTCNRVIDLLTSENGKEPSSLFVLLMSQGNPLTLVIALIKIILISRNSRTHLETRIAELIKYYINFPEEDCKWVINFFEIFNITFAIYGSNVEYNLIKMRADAPDEPSDETLEAYRVFSQLKAEEAIDLGIEPMNLPDSSENPPS